MRNREIVKTHKKSQKKDLEKDKPSSNANTPSQPLFKMEVKVDIKPYQGEIDATKFNHLLEQLEVYFCVHNIDEGHKNSFHH